MLILLFIFFFVEIPLIISTTGPLTVIFTSDYSIERSGFRLIVGCIHNIQAIYNLISINKCNIISCNYVLGNILNTCFGKIPENFYSDNNDNIYKKCYSTCKTCNQTGDEINNNCNNCIEHYTFINESFIPQHNCYLNCSYFYYFDKDGKYNCTESDLCPPQYNKVIISKKKCNFFRF